MKMAGASIVLLIPTLGCYHHMLVINVGFANKIAAAQGVPMTSQAYCLALLSPNVLLTNSPPELTTEQKQYCAAELSVVPKRGQSK
jgi:hypothetical protein